MKDKIKTLFLLLLFLTSIFLSRHIWVSDYRPLAKEEDLELGDVRLDMVRPYKALLNFSKKNHTVVYEGDDLWRESKDYISRAFSSKSVEVSRLKKEDYEDYLKKKSLVFHFPQRLNTYLLAKSLNIENANYVTEDIPKVEYIYLSLFNNERFLVIGYDDLLYKVGNFDLEIDNILDELKLVEKRNNYSNYYSAKDSMDIDSLLYISYSLVENYPYIYIGSGGDLDYIRGARNNSEEFFARDIDYIREVVEDGGTILHIYDQEVLKYSQDGSLEYFNPLQERIMERNLSISLQRASEFLRKYINGEGSLYLSGLREIEFKGNLGYRFIFRYNFDGLELLETEGEDDYVYIDVYNNYVQGYKKQMKKTISKKYPEEEAVAPFTILNENYEVFKEGYMEFYQGEDLVEDELSSRVFEGIEDISIYYIAEDIEGGKLLKPAWVFKTQNLEYMFELYSGDLIYRRKID